MLIKRIDRVLKRRTIFPKEGPLLGTPDATVTIQTNSTWSESQTLWVTDHRSHVLWARFIFFVLSIPGCAGGLGLHGCLLRNTSLVLQLQFTECLHYSYILLQLQPLAIAVDCACNLLKLQFTKIIKYWNGSLLHEVTVRFMQCRYSSHTTWSSAEQSLNLGGHLNPSCPPTPSQPSSTSSLLPPPFVRSRYLTLGCNHNGVGSSGSTVAVMAGSGSGGGCSDGCESNGSDMLKSI